MTDEEWLEGFKFFGKLDGHVAVRPGVDGGYDIYTSECKGWIHVVSKSDVSVIVELVKSQIIAKDERFEKIYGKLES